MGLVHDDQLGALQGEVLGTARGLDEVGRDHGVGVTLEDRHPKRQVALQTLDGAGQHQLGIDVEFLGKLALPLLRKMRRAQHGEALEFTPIQHFACDKRGFHGLADADVVCNQEPDGIQLERHHQWHQLIGPGLYRNAAEAAERPGGGAGGQACRFA